VFLLRRDLLEQGVVREVQLVVVVLVEVRALRVQPEQLRHWNMPVVLSEIQ
jgi:hypothetical protein